MIRTDEDALICDFAETYHIYDYRGLPLQLAATLAIGLRDNARIKMRMGEIKAAPDILMLAAIVDQLNILIWSKTKDGEKGRNRPKSILENFTKDNAETAFLSGEDFEKARKELLKKGGV